MEHDSCNYAKICGVLASTPSLAFTTRNQPVVGFRVMTHTPLGRPVYATAAILYPVGMDAEAMNLRDRLSEGLEVRLEGHLEALECKEKGVKRFSLHVVASQLNVRFGHECNQIQGEAA